MAKDLEEELLQYIADTHLQGEDPSRLDRESDLITTGVLDSLAIMGLAAHLEKAYSIKVADGDIVLENFSTIKRLADFVRRKQGSG